jgi:hypothetical protein
MNDKNINCETCEEQLFDFHEGNLDPASSALVDAHLHRCEMCSGLLNDIWQMGLVATRWQDHAVPEWQRSSHQKKSAWQLPQMLATAASMLALVLVLTDAHLVTTGSGVSLTFGSPGYVSEATFLETQQKQRAEFGQQLQLLATQQVSSDQLVLRSVLQASREERRQDFGSLVTYWSSAQARQYQETEESFRYLLASQAEDEKDIQQLSAAFQQISLKRGNDM